MKTARLKHSKAFSAVPNLALKERIKNPWYLQLTLLLLALLVTHPLQAAPSASTTVRSVAAQRVTSWQINGAIAARKQNKGWNATLNWRQQGPNQYQIRLNGPLGNGAVLITKQGNTVTYHDGPKKLTSSNAGALLARETGVRLPVNYLYYWVRGIPAPGPVQSIQRDAANHVLVLRQAGYTVQYAQYKPVKGLQLPTRIHLQSHQVFIKFVIRQWGI